MTTDQIDFSAQVQKFVSALPASQQQAASALLIQYGPTFFSMAVSDAMQLIRRIMAGDLEAVVELDSKFTDAQWLAKVQTNTARWANVAQYNKVREDLKNEILLRLAPIVLALLAGLVGL